MDDSHKKKPGRPSKEVTFQRPPFAAEVFTEKNAKRFDEHPGWSKHFMRQYLLTGDIKLAAKQANISKEVMEAIDVERANRTSVKDLLAHHGLGPEDLVVYLLDCVKAETYAKDKHGRMHNVIDLKIRLEAIRLVLKINGELDKEKPEGPKSIDLFQGMDPESKD